MTILHDAGRLFSLDTLDTRFTKSSKPSLSTASLTSGDLDSATAKDPVNERAKRIDIPKPLWETVEFYLYYLVILVAVPWMFKVAYNVSIRRLIHYASFEKRSLTVNSLSP